jgi:hypothetical protein
LSRLESLLYFTYSERDNSISFFLSVPSTNFGKPICLEWLFERLSLVSSWSPIRVRAYDYLEQEIEFTRLFPVQYQPNLLGYSFVEAVHKARPSLEDIAKMQQQQQKQMA